MTLTQIPNTPGGPTSQYGPVVSHDSGASTQSIQSNPSPTPVPGTSAPATLSPVASPSGPTPNYGPVVGPNYTPPPTPTLAPTTAVTPANVTLPPPVTPGPSPTPGPILRADLMGVQIHPFLTNEQWDKMLGLAHQLGVGWIKIQVLWSDLEPSQPSGSSDGYSDMFRTLILDLQRAHKANLHTLLSITGAPDWARPANARGKENGPPENPQDLANFVAHLIHETKPVNIDAIEIWNEPNLIREWHGKTISGTLYMTYFNAVYPVILNEEKAQVDQFEPNHRIIILTAAPAPTSTVGDGSTLDDRVWVQQLYDGGLGKYGDDVAVGIHPYSWANPPESLCCQAAPGITGWYEHPVFYFRNNIDDYHSILLKNGDSNRKLWVTEFGYASYDGLRRSDGGKASVNPAAGVGWENFLNQQQQADYDMRAFYLAQKPPYYDFLGPMMLWNLNFGILPGLIDSGREEAGFSLLDLQWNPRPVFNSLAAAPKTTPAPPQ